MNKKIKVLFAIDRMNIGGAPSVVFEQMKQINKDRFEVFLMTLYNSKKANYFDQIDFIDNDHIISFSLYKRSLFDIKTWFQIFNFLRKYKIDIVYTHLFLTNTIVRFCASLARVPTIISTEHSTYFNKHTWQIIVDRVLAKITTTIVVAHHEIAEFTADQEKIPRDKFTIIANPLSLPEPEQHILDELSEKYAIDDKKFFNILSLGRFQEEKGHEYLIQAMSNFKHTNIRCFIVGHGPLYEKLQRLIKQKGLEEVCQIIVEPERAKYFYYLANLFVLPSLREGQSIVTYEAFAAGLPVIATELDTLKGVVQDGQNGYLVSPQNPSALAEKILYLYNNKDTYERLCSNTKNTLRLYQEKSSIQHLENIFLI